MNSIFMHWIIIILGTLILSVSLSNPFYRLIIGKKIRIGNFIEIIFRFLILFIGLIIIFIGLYIESI